MMQNILTVLIVTCAILLALLTRVIVSWQSRFAHALSTLPDDTPVLGIIHPYKNKIYNLCTK